MARGSRLAEEEFASPWPMVIHQSLKKQLATHGLTMSVSLTVSLVSNGFSQC